MLQRNNKENNKVISALSINIHKVYNLLSRSYNKIYNKKNLL